MREQEQHDGLSPVLFPLDASDLRDHSVVETMPRTENWWTALHLLLHVTKTKEVAVDLRRTGGHFSTISILGEEVKVVERSSP